MPFYPNTAVFYEVMTDLFGRVIATPELAQQLAASRARLCIKTTGPEAILHLDARTVPPRVLCGDAGGKEVDLSLSMAADALHALWLGQVQLRDAFSTGQIRLETNPLRAFALLPKFETLFVYAERLYPVVLREHHLL